MSTSENQSQNPASSKEIGYVERFEKERGDWTQLIKDIAAKFRVVENMVEVQVDLYSQRQIAVDYMQQLNVLQSKLKKAHLTEWKAAYEKSGTNEDYRYTEKERIRIADEKTGPTKIKIDILQIHVEFFRETIKTIDNMIFGVKHRLEIEDFKRGNK